MAKRAVCNACGGEVWFDAYVDINGSVVTWFPDWMCGSCDAHGKYESSGDGYSIVTEDTDGQDRRVE